VVKFNHSKARVGDPKTQSFSCRSRARSDSSKDLCLEDGFSAFVHHEVVYRHIRTCCYLDSLRDSLTAQVLAFPVAAHKAAE